MGNTFKIGEKVIYNGKPATVVDLADEFKVSGKAYPSVVLEFKAIFADFGPNYPQTDRRTVIEYGLVAA